MDPIDRPAVIPSHSPAPGSGYPPPFREGRQAGPSFELIIEELVLEGFPGADRQAVGAALQSELARLFSERGLPPGMLESNGAIRRGDTGAQPADAREANTLRADIAAGPDATAESVGAQAAWAVYWSLMEQASAS